MGFLGESKEDIWILIRSEKNAFTGMQKMS